MKETFIAKNTQGDGSVWDIAFSKDPQQKYIFLADGANEKIYVIDRAVAARAHRPSATAGASRASSSRVHSIATDSKGNLYTTETYEGKRVQRFLYKGLAPGDERESGHALAGDEQIESATSTTKARSHEEDSLYKNLFVDFVLSCLRGYSPDSLATPPIKLLRQHYLLHQHTDVRSARWRFIMSAVSMGLPELLVILYIAAIALAVAWPAARICDRLGFPRWLGVLAIVPVANLALLWFVALARWPSDGTRSGM